ncbi:MAG TPA: DsbA family protein [Rhodobacteraceae bacterium]|nr:DsbA family protein [Paracoccaceae bacterium]
MLRFISLVLGAFLLLAPAAMAQDSTETIALAPDMMMGDPDAPVVVIEYASYTCPHCARFHEEVFPQMKADYIDTGKVLFVHREVFFDRYGLWAAMLARCGDGTRYFGMNDVLYGTQRDWLGSGEPQEVVNNLRNIGLVAGMEDDQIAACLEDRAMAQSLVAAYQTHSEADGIDATPTFIIDGEKYPNMAWQDMRAIIEEKLAAKEG